MNFCRGVELVDLGCQVLEVTLDTQDSLRVLKELIYRIGII